MWNFDPVEFGHDACNSRAKNLKNPLEIANCRSCIMLLLKLTKDVPASSKFVDSPKRVRILSIEVHSLFHGEWVRKIVTKKLIIAWRPNVFSSRKNAAEILFVHRSSSCCFGYLKIA